MLVSILLFGLGAKKVHFRSELFTGIRFWQATVRLTIFTWMYSGVLGKVPITGQEPHSVKPELDFERIIGKLFQKVPGNHLTCSGYEFHAEPTFLNCRRYRPGLAEERFTSADSDVIPSSTCAVPLAVECGIAIMASDT